MVYIWKSFEQWLSAFNLQRVALWKISLADSLSVWGPPKSNHVTISWGSHFGAICAIFRFSSDLAMSPEGPLAEPALIFSVTTPDVAERSCSCAQRTAHCCRCSVKCVCMCLCVNTKLGNYRGNEMCLFKLSAELWCWPLLTCAVGLVWWGIAVSSHRVTAKWESSQSESTSPCVCLTPLQIE